MIIGGAGTGVPPDELLLEPPLEELELALLEAEEDALLAEVELLPPKLLELLLPPLDALPEALPPELPELPWLELPWLLLP